MEDLIAYTILGLALGALYAVAASGLVVTYTTSGIFNFAHGAIAMLAAYVYWQLRWDDGWGGQWPAPVAFIVVIFVLAPLFGAFVERVIMRGLRDTSETTKIVIPIACAPEVKVRISLAWRLAPARSKKRPIAKIVQINDLYVHALDFSICFWDPPVRAPIFSLLAPPLSPLSANAQA